MKPKKQSQSYTAEYKTQAVKLVLEQGLSVNESAKQLNMPMQTLASWVQRAKAGKLPKTANHNSKLVDLEAENQRLQKELATAKMERDILKKATAYFAKESQRGTRS